MSEIVTNKTRLFSDAISGPSEDEAVSVGVDSASDDSSSDEKTNLSLTEILKTKRPRRLSSEGVFRF